MESKKVKITSKKRLFIVIGIIVFIVIIFIFIKIKNSSPKGKSEIPMSYHINIVKETQNNKDFRHVLYTGLSSQLVVMNIPAGGDIGEEVHKYSEQTLFFLSGKGIGMLGDKKFPIEAGDVVVVAAGTKHNFWNTGTADLKIYTVYTPPDHIDGRIQHTKADADLDTADEAIGNLAPVK